MLWTDKIEIEGSKGWYGSGEINAIFEIDFDKKRYKYLTAFDNSEEDTIRKYSVCKKYKNKLFFFPVYGNKIWIYHINTQIFSKIDDPAFFDMDCLLMNEPFIYNHYLYALSTKKKAVVIIDPETEQLHSIIQIPKEMENVSSDCMQSGNKLYCVSDNKGIICQIDLDSKHIELYMIPCMETGIHTISIESTDKFWLSGHEKQICIWDKQNQTSIVLKDFPEEFGIYRNIKDKLVIDYKQEISEDVLFIDSFCLQNYMWFIPFRTNKILYVNMETHKISSLNIPNEQEFSNGWKRYLSHKYLVNYIHENRYIGLYSTKNGYLFEIDTKEFLVKRIELILDTNSINEIASDFEGRAVFALEEISDLKKIFWLLRKASSDLKKTSNGEKIYHITI